jgi:hypothetical protein
VRLTEEEFREAAALLAELGHRTTDNYNETVLMAGSLGISCWSACSTTATAAPPRPRRICSARSGG